MRKIISSTPNWKFTDNISLASAATFQNLAESGESIKVAKAALIDTEDKDGDLKHAAAIKTFDGRYFVSIGTAIHDQVSDIVDAITGIDADGGYNEGCAFAIHVESRKSKSGRDFLVLSVDE